MATVSKKVADRTIAGIERFQPVLATAKARDTAEADTVTIVIETTVQVFGPDR